MPPARQRRTPVAHGGKHASSFNGGNPRNGLAPQDCAGSRFLRLQRT
ncbi:hypothetical protein [aff. Roholtiella sp. LEGE 12411]|nr:hypothetical protein [aff. Roholtiella sp. LEGE 12411]